MTTVAKERPALYYPYIHVRPEQESWLKATLLTHPSIVRMVPEDYAPEDANNLQPYTALEGSAGRPLLDRISTNYPTAHQAKQILYERFRETEDYLAKHFTKQQAKGNETKLQVGKFTHDLLDYLKRHGLAWETTGEERHGNNRNWYGLHRTLGNAILSTIATSIANDKGWPIITPDPRLHEELLGTTEDDIFYRLTNTKPASKDLTEQTATELGELVISTAINLDALRIEDLIELQKGKHDLRTFRDHLHKKLERIGTIPDPEERAKALQPLKEEILDEWEDYKKGVPKRIAKAVFNASNIKVPQLSTAVAAGATTVATLSTAAGIAVLLVTYAGIQVYQDYKEREKSPVKLLSTIEEKTNHYETQSTSPLMLTRDEATKRRAKPARGQQRPPQTKKRG